jgi:hypothetical protein
MTEELYEEASETAEELVGGLKNAMDSGEDITKAKQSFLNAGYTEKEVNDAANKLGIVIPNQLTSSPTPSEKHTQQTTTLPAQSTPVNMLVQPKQTSEKIEPKPSVSPAQIQPLPTQTIKPKFFSSLPSKGEVQKLPTAQFKEPQPLNKGLVAILVILGIIFIVLAGFLGIYWDQLFGPF